MIIKKTYLFLMQAFIVLSLLFAVSCNEGEEPVVRKPPTCSITAPLPNAQFYSHESIPVTVVAEVGEGDDGTINEVRLYRNNVEHGVKITYPYNFVINAGVMPAGTHTLKAVAKDHRGRPAEATVNITVIHVTNPPTCSIITPEPNAQFYITENVPVAVVAESAGGTISEVRLYIDNVEHSVKTELPYNFTINAGEMSAGSHILKAVAKDDKGVSAESSVIVNINEATSTLTCNITSPENNELFYKTENITVSVDAESAGGTVTEVRLYINNVEHSVKTTSPYNFTISAGLDYGDHILKAVAKDNKGKSAESSISIVIRLAVGAYYQGGIVAYVDDSGKHGFIVAPYDQSSGIMWSNGSNITIGGTGTAIGTGQSNTAKIIQTQGNGSYAAKLCADLVIDGYDDWFLPSRDELNELHRLKFLPDFNFDTNISSKYWSSSEYSNANAWSHYFGYDQPNVWSSYDLKNRTLRVRAIRYF